MSDLHYIHYVAPLVGRRFAKMDTSGETCESFNFVLNHYNVPFSNSRKHRLYLCNNGHLIAIVDNAGNVFIRDLYSSEVLKLSDEPSARYALPLALGKLGLESHKSPQIVFSSNAPNRLICIPFNQI